MRTLRHKLVTIYFKLIMNWMIYRTKKQVKPDSYDWMIYFRNQFEKLAFPVRKAHIKSIENEKVKGLMVSASAEPTDKIILYFHGGAYIFGSSKLYRLLAYYLAKDTQASVYLIDYPLAPEYSYKEATENALHSYEFLLESGIAPENIIVGGDSAGGGLSLALLFQLREKNLPMPKACFCISPWVDLLLSSPSLVRNKDKDYVLLYDLAWFHDAAYAYAKNQDLKDPLISPLYGDFHGLPPLLIHTGADELLLDENLLLIEKAKQAGTPVESKIWMDMPHDFHLFAPLLPEGRKAITEIASFALRQWTS